MCCFSDLLLDNKTDGFSLFLNTLHVSRYYSRLWREILPKSMIPIDREQGGGTPGNHFAFEPLRTAVPIAKKRRRKKLQLPRNLRILLANYTNRNPQEKT